MTVYLDHAATSPLSPVAQEAWVETAEALRGLPGNPAAVHAGGRAARRLLEDARERVGAAIGAEKNEVLFTSGATESDALAVLGVARASGSNRRRIVVSAVEHDAVAAQREAALREGFTWEMLPVSHDGVSGTEVADPETVAAASMSLVCAETGIIQPVKQLAENVLGRAPVHTDAAQAVGRIPVDFEALGTDLLTVGGHKVGGPVGIGALVAARSVKLITDRAGGGQERKFRSGTQDVAGAVAFAAALEETVNQTAARVALYEKLRKYLIGGLPGEVTVTSSAPAAPGIVHLTLPTSHPEILLMMMDRAGVLVSAGSACHAGVTRPSEILLRMGRDERGALGVLRVSFGPETKPADVDTFLAAIPGSLEAAQAMDRRKR